MLAKTLLLYSGSLKAAVKVSDTALAFEYKGHNYRLEISGASVLERDGNIEFSSEDGRIVLYPKKGE